MTRGHQHGDPPSVDVMTSSRAGSTECGGRVVTLNLVQVVMPRLPSLRTRWAMTAGISVTELVSWGTLVYAFSAFVVPMHADLGWSPAVFTSTYTAASLLSGVVAVPVGRVLARRSPHAVMLAGAVLACLGLVAWSQRCGRSSRCCCLWAWRWRRRSTCPRSCSRRAGSTSAPPAGGGRGDDDRRASRLHTCFALRTGPTTSPHALIDCGVSSLTGLRRDGIDPI